MTHDKIITRPSEQEAEAVQSGGDPSADGPSPLLQQAEEYSKIAREALEDCLQGAEAEQELIKRRKSIGTIVHMQPVAERAEPPV